jgi:hypothetical protein
MFKIVQKALVLFTEYSLVVVLGVTASFVFFSKRVDLYLSFYDIVAPAYSLFLIYFFDHFFDNSHNPQRFKYIPSKNHPLIKPFFVFFSLGAVFLLFNVSEYFLLPGIVAIVFVAIYFLLLHYSSNNCLKYFKEFFIALVVTFVVTLMPMWVVGEFGFWYSFLFGLLCFQNTLFFSLIDNSIDLENNTPNLISELGMSQVKNILLFISVFSFLIYLILFWVFGGFGRMEWMLFGMQMFFSVLSFLLYKKGFPYHSKITIDSMFLIPLAFSF